MGCVSCGCPTPRRRCRDCELDEHYGSVLQEDRDQPDHDGIAYLGESPVDRHYCDICQTVHETLDELADHDCRDDDPDPALPVVADDGPGGRVVYGPGPVVFERWEQAHDSGGDA